MKENIRSIVVLTVICIVISAVLAFGNHVTAPIIEEAEKAAANESLLVVMPEGKGFEAVDISHYTLPETVTEAYSEESGGYVFKMITTGYSTGMVIMCGVDSNGTVTGAVCLSSGETLGYEKTYGESFPGVTSDTVMSVDTITGATRTTEAYRGAVNDALNAFTILNGGSVDLRTEEEILADNLNVALPAAEGAFTPWFMVEDLADITDVYVADNGMGYVFVTGDTFVGVDAEGNVIQSENDLPAIADAYAKVTTSTLEALDLTSYEGLPSQVLGASVTGSGNYVFDLRAAGYGINGGSKYHPASGEYIYLKVSVTPEGKIIACQTLSQAETEGIGSYCADPEFYSQFNGKDQSNYSDIDAIGGATYTTDGYKTAVSKVFEALQIIKGGE